MIEVTEERSQPDAMSFMVRVSEDTRAGLIVVAEALFTWGTITWEQVL